MQEEETEVNLDISKKRNISNIKSGCCAWIFRGLLGNMWKEGKYYTHFLLIILIIAHVYVLFSLL